MSQMRLWATYLSVWQSGTRAMESAYYGSGNLPGSANQGILGILFLNPTLQEEPWKVPHECECRVRGST